MIAIHVAVTAALALASMSHACWPAGTSGRWPRCIVICLECLPVTHAASVGRPI